MWNYFQLISPAVLLLSYIVLFIYKDMDAEDKSPMIAKSVISVFLLCGIMGFISKDLVLIVSIIATCYLAWSDYKYHIIHLPTLVSLFLVTVMVIPNATNTPYALIMLAVVIIALILPFATADLIGVLIMGNILMAGAYSSSTIIPVLAVLGAIMPVLFLVKDVKKEGKKLFPIPLLFPLGGSIALCLASMLSFTQVTLIMIGISMIPLSYYLLKRSK